MNFLEKKLDKRKKLGNLRTLKVLENLIDFSSNDYLGLAKNPRCAESSPLFNELRGSHLFGSTGSRLLSGNSLFAQELEKKIASFHRFESATLFNCGYMANLGLLPAVSTVNDLIFFDSFIHASTQEGIRLSASRAYPFRHNDMDHLENRLKKITISGEKFLCVESVYSQDGSIAPIADLLFLTRKYHLQLIIDEAHAVGILGEQGRGLCEGKEVFAKIITFGKALGSMGAMILGSHLLREVLVNYALPFIFSTALSPIALQAINRSYRLFPHMEKERSHLRNLIKLLEPITSSQTAIQPIIMPGNNCILQKSYELQDKGFDVRAILSPTVKKGCETLRICLHAFNTEEQVHQLIKNL